MVVSVMFESDHGRVEDHSAGKNHDGRVPNDIDINHTLFEKFRVDSTEGEDFHDSEYNFSDVDNNLIYEKYSDVDVDDNRGLVSKIGLGSNRKVAPRDDAQPPKTDKRTTLDSDLALHDCQNIEVSKELDSMESDELLNLLISLDEETNKRKRRRHFKKFQKADVDDPRFRVGEKPILGILEKIRIYIMMHMKTKRDWIRNQNIELCPKIAKKLEKLKNASATCIARFTVGEKFEITHNINKSLGDVLSGYIEEIQGNVYQTVTEIVVWNLRNSRSIPDLVNQSGVALVCSFSENLLTMFLEGGGIFNHEEDRKPAIASEESLHRTPCINPNEITQRNYKYQRVWRQRIQETNSQNVVDPIKKQSHDHEEIVVDSVEQQPQNHEEAIVDPINQQSQDHEEPMVDPSHQQS
ncbi:hypothetical protein ACH5RR_024106 [Cinchona calisaya]|uniref:DUF7788 domain-containing protein n=1 Tax=Cinchona calisaya TaxID=153742 RepID=A0ABD2ZDN3_9GENT